MGALRAFWALEPGAAARRRAAAVAAALGAGPGGGDVRWVREEALHVTLRFLGDTDPARLPELVGAVGTATRGVAPFALGLGGVELFPSRRPRVVALGLAPCGPLTALAEAVERGCVAAGLPAEPRPFRPHLTLGRARRGRRPRPEPAVTASVTAPGETWDVVEIVLFRSQLSSDGARYTPLERVSLGGEAPGGPLHP